MRRKDKQNTSNGAWLTVVPTEKNGSVLGKTKWVDSVRLRTTFNPNVGWD